MKRLLSVVAFLAMAASLLPAKGQAGLRGSFDPVTTGDDKIIKGHFDPAFRPFPRGNNDGSNTGSRTIERWLSWVTTSQVVGRESVGEIWQQRNRSRAALNGVFAAEIAWPGDSDPEAKAAFLQAALLAARRPILQDPTAGISYIDPKWSSDGKWLAYVQTDNAVTSTIIYVQQYTLSNNDLAAVTPLGGPILVASGGHNRHPSWNPAGTQIAYDSDALGSIDLWTVNVSLDPVAHTGTVDEASRVRHSLGFEIDQAHQDLLNGKAEFKPAYSPDGTRIAYVTNLFGSFQIRIVSLTADGNGETVQDAEAGPALVTHDNPAWSSDGQSLYYDAPAQENADNPQDIFKLDLATGAKCGVHIDLAGDVNPDVSSIPQVSKDGIPFNYIIFTSQAGGFGVQIWRGDYIQTCVPPLPMIVSDVKPGAIDLTKALVDTAKISLDMSFPPETKAAGYRCLATNGGGKEGVRMRVSILPSPTLFGLAPLGSGTGLPNFSDNTAQETITCHWNRRKLAERLVSLGFTSGTVPLTVAAYSNIVGRQFQGFGYLGIRNSPSASGAIVMQQAYPNPFNPQTKITFANSHPGTVDVRVFNVRGELVRTIANQWFPQGEHTVSWDGRTDRGLHTPSGVYYVRAKTGGSTDVIKAVLAE